MTEAPKMPGKANREPLGSLAAETFTSHLRHGPDAPKVLKGWCLEHSTGDKNEQGGIWPETNLTQQIRWKIPDPRISY